MRIIFRVETAWIIFHQLLDEYGGADEASIAAYENVIDELAELKQMELHLLGVIQIFNDIRRIAAG